MIPNNVPVELQDDFQRDMEARRYHQSLVETVLGGNQVSFLKRFIYTKRSACYVGMTSYRKLTPLQAAIIVQLFEEEGFKEPEAKRLTQTIFKPAKSKIDSLERYNQNNRAKINLLYKKANSITKEEKSYLWNLYQIFRSRTKGCIFLREVVKKAEIQGVERDISPLLPYTKGLHKITLEKKMNCQYRLYMAIMAVYQRDHFKTDNESFFDAVGEQYAIMWHNRDIDRDNISEKRMRNIMTQMLKDGFWMTKIKVRGNYRLMPWRHVVKAITGTNFYSEKRFCRLLTEDFLGEIVRFESKFIYTRQIRKATGSGTCQVRLFLSKLRLADEMGWKARKTIKKYCDEFIDKINGRVILIENAVTDVVKYVCQELQWMIRWSRHYKPIKA